MIFRIPSMDRETLQKKIKEYEHFIEVKLKGDLKEIEAALTLKSEKYKEWQEVKNVLKTVREFKEKDRDMNVKVNIGHDVLVLGEVDDYERTYIDVGLGCLLEMDCDEANKYSDIRMKLLEKEIDHFRKLAINVKVHIKLTLLGINELLSAMK